MTATNGQIVCPPELQIAKKTIAQVFEYEISFNGAVTPIGNRSDAPVPTVSWTPGSGVSGNGNDYVVTFPAGTDIGGAYIEVEGDINTGVGAGINANAVITQNATVTANVVGFSLYTGDDGGGADDTRRRDVRLMITTDCEVVADVTLA